MTSTNLSNSKKMLVGEILRRSAHKTPDKIAFSDADKNITYLELEERSVKVAGWIQSENVNSKKNIGILMKNRIEFAEIFFGVSLSGSVGVPINFRLAKDELKYVIGNSECKILFVESEYMSIIEEVISDLPLLTKIVIIGNVDKPNNKYIYYNNVINSTSNYYPLSLTDDDPAVIIYTSGTTGKPKGAVLTHKNLFINIMVVVSEFGVGHEMKQIIITPLFHVAGFMFMLMSILSEGTTIIKREFNNIDVLKTIESYKIDTLFLVPTMWRELVNTEGSSQYILNSMKRCMTGGSSCSKELKKKIMSTFKNSKTIDIFGQTEVPTTTCLRPEDSLRKTESIGKPVFNIETKVVDENMESVPIGQVGEIVYRGPTVFKEYYRNSSETKKAFEGGWFRSGDLVKLDDEGYVYIIDRKKDMIISGGENIYSVEVENALSKHDSIAEVAVKGVFDKKWGEAVKAFIVLKEGESLAEEEVFAHCQKYLSSYKKPKYIEFIDELPRNSSGKILKIKLK